MLVTETLSDGLKRAYAVVLPAADIAARRSAKLAELGKTLKMPGFRPGKVPLPIVQQRYGQAVGAEVLEESVTEAARQVLSERGLRPAVEPKIDLVAAAEGADVEFKVELEIMPEIAAPDLAAISLTRLKSEPTDEAVERALGEIAKRQRELVEPEQARPARVGDVLTVDYAGSIDGVAFEGGTGTDMDVELGGEGFIPGFVEGMVGMNVGESRDIDVTFPAEYGKAELAGKPARFAITAKRLREPAELPIDDALAARIGFEGGIGELRDAVKQQIQREYDQLSRMKLKRALLDVLAAGADFAVPEGVVVPEFDQIWQRVEADMKDGKLDEEDAGKDEATLRAEYRAIAERRVRLGLLLSEIGRANSIQVSQDELLRAMRTEASRYPGQERQVLEFFQKNPRAVESLRGPIFEEKVVDFILELAKLEEKPVSPEDLTAEEPSAA
jgi:trigger factor